MWISRAEYENLKANIRCLEARYTEQLKMTNKLIDNSNDQSMEIYELRKQTEQIDIYKQELEEYKQKYADEVNKRLELIKFYEERNT